MANDSSITNQSTILLQPFATMPGLRVGEHLPMYQFGKELQSKVEQNRHWEQQLWLLNTTLTAVDGY